MNTNDIKTKITNDIIAKLEEGVGSWTKSWATSAIEGLPTSAASGKTYNGINLLVLMMQGYDNKFWITYNQAKKLGGQVRKGEKGTTVILYKPIVVADRDTGEDKSIRLMKSFTVFNVEQVDDLPEKFFVRRERRNQDEAIAEADAYVAACGPTIGHGGDRAYYSPGDDAIQMPMYGDFDSAVSYYGTLLHELTHWSGHESRMDREIKNPKGNQNYAKEELVAEIGAAFLCGQLGIESTVRDDHVAYLANWISVLKEDSGAIFTAAATAQRAVDFLDGLQADEQEQAA